MIERSVAGQLQGFLNEADGLDPFQSGFRPGYGTEMALGVLVDVLHNSVNFPSPLDGFFYYYSCYFSGLFLGFKTGRHCSALVSLKADFKVW